MNIVVELKKLQKLEKLLQFLKDDFKNNRQKYKNQGRTKERVEFIGDVGIKILLQKQKINSMI